ncbi:MAG: Flp pilus assembly protein CpaB [Alphaproteobacteria bacterium]|nr:Flp pilus assembly protein CpaB [Alphaproteobacteria bacterium]
MNMRLIALVLVAVIAAGGAIFGANTWLANQRAELEAAKRNQVQVKKNHTRIIVAKKALPAGTLIKKNQLRWQAWPDAGLSEAYLVNGEVKFEDLEGTVVRLGIAPGEPLTEARVVRPGERGFLAAVLRPGFRAITVGVNTTSGIAGFVFPGDKVDLILSHSVGREGKNGRVRRASETVLADVRVLAIDQSTNDQAEKPNPAKNVTLEVTPKQAEIVSLISDIGRLSLSLRSLQQDEGAIDGVADTGDAVNEAAEPELNPVLASLIAGEEPERSLGHTWDSEVSRLLKAPRSNANRHRVQVVRGGQAAFVEFSRSGSVESVDLEETGEDTEGGQ